MRENVLIEEISLATVPVFAQRESVSNSATGFIIKHQERFFLATALHVLTGRHWQTKKPISTHGFLPEHFIIKLPFYKRYGDKSYRLAWTDMTLKPHDGEAAPWLVHPIHRENIDIGLLPLDAIPQDLLNKMIASGHAEQDSRIFSLTIPSRDHIRTRVGDDLFVVGFPEKIKSAGHLPIWKRGSVASEPDVPATGELPFVLVDTGTRSGMSGAPAIRRVPAGLAQTGALGEFHLTNEPQTELYGVYSSRFGADDLTSQLGIVWPRFLLSDILATPTLGKSSLHTWLW